MLAIRQHDFGGPDVLRVDEIDDPVPSADQVRIRVAAAGVHLVDAALRRGQPLGPFGLPQLPMVPGREVAGIVDAVGDQVDGRGWLGKPVVANLGPSGGGYAQLALAPVSALHELPDDMSFDDAVAMVGTGATAFAILDTAAPAPGDLAVVAAAAGGIGTLLVQGLRRAGADVIGLVGSAEKLGVVDQLGARWAFTYDADGWQDDLRAAVDGRPITLGLDAVGGKLGRAVLESLDVGGRFVMFGEAAGGICELTAEDLFQRGITAMAAAGARLRRRPGGLRPLEDQALHAAHTRTLTPVIGQRFALKDAAEAHRAIENRSTVGKTVLHVLPT
jgi:NADPH2:quinone reductase